jgi:hypothetical protein
MKAWFESHARNVPGWQSWLPMVEWWTEKPPAQVMLDDRAMPFRGTWPTIDEVVTFRPWYLPR